MAFDPDPQSHNDEVTRLIQEGRRPEDLNGRAQLAVDKLQGDVPLGVDAPNRVSRKAIGGAGSLFVVLKYGFFGVFLTAIGLLFIWAGSHSPFEIKTVLIGAGLLALGLFGLSKALRAWKVLRAISRA